MEDEFFNSYRNGTSTSATYQMNYETISGMMKGGGGLWNDKREYEEMKKRRDPPLKLCCPNCKSTTFISEVVKEIEIASGLLGLSVSIKKSKSKKTNNKIERRTICKYCRIEVNWKKSEECGHVKLNG